MNTTAHLMYRTTLSRYLLSAWFAVQVLGIGLAAETVRPDGDDGS